MLSRKEVTLKKLPLKFSAKQTTLLRNVKIKNRLLCIFLFISLVPVTFIGFYAYTVYTKSINNKLQYSNEQALYLLNKNFITELNTFRMYIDTISVSNECQEILSAPSDANFILKEQDVQAINDLRTRIPFPSIHLKNLRILDRNRNIIYDFGYDDIDSDYFSRIVEEIDTSSPHDSLQYIHTYRSSDKIIIGRKIYSSSQLNEHIGYILIYLDETFFSNKLFSNVAFGEESNIMLVRNDGYIISSQDRSLLGKLLDNALLKQIRSNQSSLAKTVYTEYKNEQVVLISAYNEAFDNYLITYFPYHYITDETTKINQKLVLLAFVLITLCICLTLIVYTSIMQPIHQMVEKCNNISYDRLNTAINDPSPDELGFLSRTIDQMLYRIHISNMKQAQNEEQKRSLELSILQYQINTHFLFNTLNSLRVVAQMNSVPILEQGISSLSFLLQQTLVKKQEIIPLSQEIENLNHYFTIQGIRYAGMFDVKYKLENSSLSYEIPRFALQPLAENAIIHGTANANMPITIFIESHFSDNNSLKIVIRDNGCGFNSNETKQTSKKCGSGIGVENVDQRIKLHYGTSYGLSVESHMGEGTICTLTLPRILYEEEQ